MSMLQINTAVPLMEPLLEQRTDQEKRESERTNRESGNRTKFAVLGAIAGFFIQIVSLGAYAFLLVHYRGLPLQTAEDAFQTDVARVFTVSGFFRASTALASNTNSGNEEDALFGNKTILYTFVSVLTQIDLIAYVLIWVAFTCTMTQNGMACIRSQFFGQTQHGEGNLDKDSESPRKKHNHNNSNKKVKRRDVFVLGVYFLAGIVLGAFAAWSAIDLYLGFPIPFKPIITTVTVDLLLCYLMVWCYDLGGKKKRRLDEETEFSNYDSDDDDYC